MTNDETDTTMAPPWSMVDSSSDRRHGDMDYGDDDETDDDGDTDDDTDDDDDDTDDENDRKNDSYTVAGTAPGVDPCVPKSNFKRTKKIIKEEQEATRPRTHAVAQARWRIRVLHWATFSISC